MGTCSWRVRGAWRGLEQAEHRAMRLRTAGACLVEPVRREGVGCPEQLVEVVCPKVVPHKAEDGDPHVGLDPVALRQRLAAVGPALEQRRQDHAGQRGRQADAHVAPLAQALRVQEEEARVGGRCWPVAARRATSAAGARNGLGGVAAAAAAHVVELQRDQKAQAPGNPHRAVGQEEKLRPTLARVLRQPADRRRPTLPCYHCRRSWRRKAGSAQECARRSRIAITSIPLAHPFVRPPGPFEVLPQRIMGVFSVRSRSSAGTASPPP